MSEPPGQLGSEESVDPGKELPDELALPEAPLPAPSAEPAAEADPDESEVALPLKQKQDSTAVINILRIKPVAKSRMCVPLCRMRALPLVRPVNEVDVQRLENEFVTGYRDGDRAMYVSNYDNHDQMLDVTEDIYSSWSDHWKEASARFDSHLAFDEDLAHMVGKMFFVWEGNHRLTAWWRHVNKFHADDPLWHISPHCIVVDAQRQTGVLLNAMNDVNWSTENDHVKTSLPVKLHRIRTFGALKLEEFEPLISKDDYVTCVNAKSKVQTWYPLTIDVFISFLYKRELSAARAYKDETPFEHRTAVGIWRAMTTAEDKARKSIRSKSFEKYVAVANMKNGEEFFDEINRHFSFNATPDMTIEKLHKLSTATVAPRFKAKWLHWWNSPLTVRAANKFPSTSPLRERTLDSWLNKASFWAQLEDSVEQMFADVESIYARPIDWNASGGVLHPGEFVDRWRIMLWDKAFLPLFTPKNLKFFKGSNLPTFDGGSMIIKRVLYRYIFLELVPKHALFESFLPAYLEDWMDASSKEFMFTQLQVSQFPASYLKSGGWYIDCAGGFVPASEESLHRNLTLMAPLELIHLEETEQPDLQPELQKEKAPKGTRGKGKRDKQGNQATQASEANITRSASNSAAPTTAVPTASAPTLPLPVASLSEGTIPSALLRKKRTVLPDGSVTSSQSFSVSTLIENVDMTELIEIFTATQVHDPRYTQIQDFLSKVGGGRHRRNSKAKTHSGIDMLFADIPKNLPVPVVSDSAIPEWNQRSEYYLENLFTFADANLHDDGILILMHPDDPELSKEIYGWAFTFDLVLVKDWWGLNELHLTSPTDPAELTRKFYIKVFTRMGSSFSIRESKKWVDIGFSIRKDGMLSNFTDDTNQLMNGDKPWRGAREKNDHFLSIIFDTITQEGASIAACRSSGRHIVAVERDTEIFNAVLLPLRDREPPSQQAESSRPRPPAFQEPMQKKQRRVVLCAGAPTTPPRVLTAEMFSTPSKPFYLPTYAGGLAQAFAEAPSPVSNRQRPYNSRVLAFVDNEAKEGKGSDDSSSSSP